MDPETRGERAAQILDNEVFQQAVQEARDRIKDEWAQQSSQESRERLWHRLQAIDEVAKQLRVIRDNGTKSRHDREQRQRKES